MSQPAKAAKKPNLVSVTTINEDGSRFMLHPADVRGRFTFARRIFGLALILVYVALPWIRIGGFPALFFDLVERRFHIFGLTFVAQDLWLGFFLISGVGFGLFYLTSLFGRLWCGWACPYTVFLDHIFRRIERWIDGDAAQRRKLDRAPWTGGKIARRILKQTLFLLAAATIAHIFLSYFVSLPRLYAYMKESPLAHAQAFGVVLFLTAALYFCFAWFREQFCVILCPYGRIQSALTDDNTAIIGYDAKRGEPRGKANDGDAGDCVSCNRCVQVCPTGIDIRNGLQLECIGCAACVDACDDIMAKLKRPKGLIRYDSMNGLAGGKTRWIRPRIIFYTIMMAAGLAALSFSLTKVHDVNMTVTRMRSGMPYFFTEESVGNHLIVRAITKRNVPTSFHIEIVGAPEGVTTSGLGEDLVVSGQGEEEHPFIITVPKAKYSGRFTFTVRSTSEPGGTIIERKIDFVGPDPRLFLDEPGAKP
jgi:cytochrome c oxidase accessory protein FixG